MELREPSLSCLGRLRRCWSCWLSKVVVMWSCKTLKALWGRKVRWFLVGGMTWQGGRSKWLLNLEDWGNVKVDSLCYIGSLDPIPTTSYQQERKSGTILIFKCRQTGALSSEFAMCLCVRSFFFEEKSTFLTGTRGPKFDVGTRAVGNIKMPSEKKMWIGWWIRSN